MEKINRLKTKITDFFLKRQPKLQNDQESSNSSGDEKIEFFEEDLKFSQDYVTSNLIECSSNELQVYKVFTIHIDDINALEKRSINNLKRQSANIQIQDPRKFINDFNFSQEDDSKISEIEKL